MPQWVGGGARHSDLFDDPNVNKPPSYDDSDSGKDRTANDLAYEWGGKQGLASADANAMRLKAMGWRQHANPWDTQTRGAQLALTQQLAAPGPTAAGALGQAGRDAAMRQALMGSAAGQPLAAASAQLQPGTFQAGVQAGQLANQEGQAQSQLLGTTLGQGRGQDINEVNFDANQNAEMEQFYQRQGFNIAQAQMLAQIAKRKQNVSNWQRLNSNELAKQDRDYALAQYQHNLNRQDMQNTGQAAGQALGIIGKAAQ